MSRFITLVYGSAVYLFFLTTFLYAIAFVEGVPAVKTIDSGAAGDVRTAILINVLLLGVFAVQHSVMARRGFKIWWTRIVPQPAERSTYVLAASLALALLVWQWRPIPDPVWSVDNRYAGLLLVGMSWVGWAILLVATFLINHFELFGLQQVYNHWRGGQSEPPAFRTPALYRLVRHPIYLGFVVAVWAAPHMSTGRLLFAIMTTAYIFIGIFFEERDLIVQFGNKYRRYRTEVGMLFPRMARVRTDQTSPTQRRTS